MLAENNGTGGGHGLKFCIPGFYIFRCRQVVVSRGGARTTLPTLAALIARSEESDVEPDCVGVRVAEQGASNVVVVGLGAPRARTSKAAMTLEVRKVNYINFE